MCNQMQTSIAGQSIFSLRVKQLESWTATLPYTDHEENLSLKKAGPLGWIQAKANALLTIWKQQVRHPFFDDKVKGKLFNVNYRLQHVS
mgnify:CR=1 FL=1